LNRVRKIKELSVEILANCDELEVYRNPGDVAYIIALNNALNCKSAQIRQFKAHTRSIIKILESDKTRQEKIEMITAVLEAMGGDT